MAEIEIVPSDLYSFVYFFLLKNNLKKAARMMKKETNKVTRFYGMFLKAMLEVYG